MWYIENDHSIDRSNQNIFLNLIQFGLYMYRLRRNVEAN
jgi:hypothetical protein